MTADEFPNADKSLGPGIERGGRATIKALRAPLFLIVIACLLPGCGAPSVCPCAYYAPNCCLSITNESGLDLEAVVIESRNGAKANVPMLHAGADTNLTLQGKGEDTYRIMAYTLNGDTIKGNATYYEDGYWIDNRILRDTIVTEVKP